MAVMVGAGRGETGRGAEVYSSEFRPVLPGCGTGMSNKTKRLNNQATDPNPVVEVDLKGPFFCEGPRAMWGLIRANGSLALWVEWAAAAAGGAQQAQVWD